jgi:O-antigen/teichoic acid export membrane protein
VINKIAKIKESLLNPGKKLSEKVVYGGIWVFITRIISRLFQFIRTIILARLLAPNDFGLFGIALLSLNALQQLSQTGFNQALIQKKENINLYLNSAWTIQIIRGFILGSILFFIAPLIASFFNTPRAVMLVRVIGIALFIKELRNIGIVYFKKELEFHKQFLYEFSGTIADVIVALTIAFIYRSVWALIFGLLAGNLVRFIISYVVHNYRPKLHLDWSKSKELFNFGRWVLGSSVLIFLITQGDDIFVGKLLGVAALGFYQLAYRISNMPATEITHVISQVTFPAYSKLQNDTPKLREAYLKVLQLTAFLSFPIAGLIFVLSSDFTRIFLGEKWMPMVPAMQMLVFAGLVRSIAATAGPIFQAVGKPKIDTRWQIVRLFVIATLIYPCIIKWGILGASIVVFLSIFVSNIGFSFSAIRITRCEFKSFSKVIVFPLINGIAMVSSIFILKTYINITGILNFILLLSIGILIYLVIIYIFDKYLNYNMQQLLRQNLISFKKGL